MLVGDYEDDIESPLFSIPFISFAVLLSSRHENKVVLLISSLQNPLRLDLEADKEEHPFELKSSNSADIFYFNPPIVP